MTDAWWVNGRNRSLSACIVVEVEPGNKKLPPPVGPVATVLAACGKARKTVQAPLAGKLEPGAVPAVRLPIGVALASPNPEAARAVHEIVVKYRKRLPEILQRAQLPHDQPYSARLALGLTSDCQGTTMETFGVMKRRL